MSAPIADTQVETAAPHPSQPASVAAPESSQLEVAVGEHPGYESGEAVAVPAKKAAAKRPARKSTAKKVAASAAPVGSGDGDAPVTDDVSAADVPKKRAPRKRPVKKVAELAPSGEPAGWVEPATVQTTEPDEASSPVETPSVQFDEAAAQLAEDDPAAAPGAESPAPVEAAVVDAAVVDEDVVDAAVVDEDLAEAEAATDEPRDFRWLADPFAVPVSEAPAESVTSPSEVSEPQSDRDESDTDTASPSEDSGPEAGSDDDESGDGGNRRRRRRRGGRRRRRGGPDDDASDSDDESGDEHAATGSEVPTAAKADDQDSSDKSTGDNSSGDNGAGDNDTDDNGDETDGDDSEGQRRRRRRRRRRGEETAALPDDPTDVVVRVREPRPRKKAASNNEVTGIEGSTRMEAKRQRRKEGRDAGRRRAPILSEAEFLTRRESVNRKMIIRQRDDLAQIAVLEDGILVEHYVDRDSAASLIGNVFLGRVQNVLPSMEAAFIDIGRGRNAVLYAGEVDWDSFGAEGHNRKVEKVLKSGQMILVQVSKDPVGAKGARLTNHVSIPGRYVVYAPGGHLSGISRKLPDVERRRLKDILADLVGESASVIVRTAAEGASEDELVRDVNRLKAQWEDIERKVKAGNSPQLLYGEPDLTVRIVRDLFTEDFSELIIQGNGSMNDAYDAIQGYVTHVAPHLQERIRRWEPTGEDDLFAEYRLDEQIAKALERKVFLPSGGSLVIDRTEAMTVIDVNTGKFTGTGGNLEATVTSNNLEAAEEIVNQLRLRDIGGIIVIDFIDMVLPNNRELLLRRLVECLGRDRTRHQVAEVTSLGLVQMTRKKIGTGLLEAFGTECPHCHGRGYELHDMPVDTQKQADGGTREPQRGGRDHRPKPADIARAVHGSRDSSRQDTAQTETDSPRSDSPRSDSNGSSRPPHNDSVHDSSSVDDPTDAASSNGNSSGHADDNAEQSDRNRGRRGRRGGGRGGSNREQESPAESQPATG